VLQWHKQYQEQIPFVSEIQLHSLVLRQETWSSATPTVATVDSATGVVTGLQQEPINYSVTTTGGCVNTASRTVTGAPMAQTVSGTNTVCIGSTTTFSSTTWFRGTWSSATPTVATVNANRSCNRSYSRN
jgi:hypothetical protein